jgi:diaminopimelate decarboxylase
MINKETLGKLKKLPTPFYYYDMDVLSTTLTRVRNESEKRGYKVYYAVKSNFNPVIMKTISGYGFGADCVSGNEISHAIECGFVPDDIVFAGVGKSDAEIELGLTKGISCFNCESVPELLVINEIAGRLGKAAPVAFRINPNVEAHTLKHITTGTEENKFGIRLDELQGLTDMLPGLSNIIFKGIHFHIGSQVTDMSPFRNLCSRVNEVWEWFTDRGFENFSVNVGGGLGINYEEPDQIPDYREYFEVFEKHLDKRIRGKISFELGRSLTAMCGTLISRVLYVKEGATEKFVILDAGMTDLLRPALYQAYHRIENLTSAGKHEKYTVAGPICESTDTFGRFIELPETQRGDIIAIRSAGAYGESMASRYNMRNLPRAFFSDRI